MLYNRLLTEEFQVVQHFTFNQSVDWYRFVNLVLLKRRLQYPGAGGEIVISTGMTELDRLMSYTHLKLSMW